MCQWMMRGMCSVGEEVSSGLFYYYYYCTFYIFLGFYVSLGNFLIIFNMALFKPCSVH